MVEETMSAMMRDENHSASCQSTDCYQEDLARCSGGGEVLKGRLETGRQDDNTGLGLTQNHISCLPILELEALTIYAPESISDRVNGL